MSNTLKGILLGAAALAVLLVLANATGVVAFFTDTEMVKASVIVAGTLDIVIENPHWLGSAQPKLIKPGDTITFEFTLRSVGALPLDYIVEPELHGPLAAPPEAPNRCDVSQVRIDGDPITADSLSTAGGPDDRDVIQVKVTMPEDAPDRYQGKKGHLKVTVQATQQ